MKEHPVDTVLRTLGEAEPTEGLEQRILVALRAGELRSESPRRSFRLFWIPVTAAVAVVIAMSVLLLRQHPSPAPLAVTSQARNPVVPVVRRSTATPPVQHHSSRVAQPLDLPTAQPDREASFPAPPMPLTKQEKLLIRFVHKNDPVQLASLAYNARATRFERDKADVKAFFAPSFDPPAPDAVQQDPTAAHTTDTIGDHP